MKWCGQVFRDPVPIVCDLLTEVLNSLNPSLPESVGTLLQEKGDTLNTLITLKEVRNWNLVHKVHGHILVFILLLAWTISSIHAHHSGLAG